MGRYKCRVLAAALLLAVLCAAAVGLWPDTAEDSPEGQQRTVLRVVLWDYDTVGYDRRLIEAFEQANPDIDVAVTSYSPTYYDYSLEALLESGEQVDVIYANQLPQYAWLAQNGYLLPLDTWIERDGLDLSCYAGVDVLRADGDGGIMGLPYRQDKFLLYYNKDLFDAAGLPYPSSSPTWDEVCTLAQQLNTQIPDIWGIFLSAMPDHLIPQSLDSGADAVHAEPAALLQGLERYRQLAADGAAPPFASLDNADPAQRLFETGRYGMFLNGSWYLNFLAADTLDGTCGFRWGVTARPGSAAGAAQNPMMLTPVCIHRDTASPEAAWRFVRFVCGAEGAGILADELVLPAYHDAQTDAVLAARARALGIDEVLVLEGFDAPAPLPDARERALRNTLGGLYGRALLGLDSVEGFPMAVQQARAQAGS